MKLTYYLYNTFLIETDNKKIVIDPGATLYFFSFNTLLPKSEWQNITHIFVTHGDPDHHWNTDRVATSSNAPIVCNKTMIIDREGKKLMLGPRSKGLAFTMPIDKFHTVSVDETIQLDGMRITGIKTTHGPLTFKLGPFVKKMVPGPKERIGYGAIGFKIQLDGKNLVNLGDTLLHEEEWAKIENTDVLMIPIGGKIHGNTMDEREALKTVRIIKPKLVIACHYNLPSFFQKNYNITDDKMFQKEVEEMGIKCVILQNGDSVDI